METVAGALPQQYLRAVLSTSLQHQKNSQEKNLWIANCCVAKTR